jgi:3-oxoacyl-ACP reductase-like protein
MGLFTTLLNKITGHSTAAQATAAQAPASAPVQKVPAATAQPAYSSAAATSPPPAAVAPPPAVDVAAVLDALAKKNPEKLDWKKSIVDLMKLVGMDSSLGSRKELAKELNYTGDTGDSAKMNVWLHKEVLKQLAANGGKVPPDLLD